MKRLLAGLMFVAATVMAAAPAWAQKTVTFAYQDMMNPWRWVQQSQEIEKATGFKINWRQFGGGGDVIRAMASGAMPCCSKRRTKRARLVFEPISPK